jgi:hypothetical protein
MRRALISLLISVLLAVAMHIVPYNWFDEFIYVDHQGRLYKVFPRGWPLTYLVEVEFHDNLWVIALKLLANVIFAFLLVWLILFLWSKLWDLVVRKVK